MLLFRAISNISLFTLSVIISPLLIVFYLLCWIWVKLVSVIYGFKKCILLTGMDTIPSMEFDSINGVVNTLLFTQDNIPVGAIQEKVVDKIINATDGKNRPLFPKFTSCLSFHAGYLMWSEAINFNIDEHIGSFHGQPPHNEAELKTLVTDLSNRSLPLSRPCWQFTFIPLQYTQTSDNTCAPKMCVLIRIHHTIGDGISLSRILFEVLGDEIGAIRQVLKRMDKKFTTRFPKSFKKVLEMLFQIAQVMFLAPAVMWRYQFNNDQTFRHKSKLSGINIYDWSSPIKLSIIKDIKNATSTTVNDVIMSCLSGALRKVLLTQGRCPPYLHTFFLVNLQRSDDPIEAKNNLTYLITPLATGDMGRLQRLKATKAIMDPMKRSPDLVINRLFIQYISGTIPHRITRYFLERTHQTVLFSNVPGPSNKLDFNGQIDAIVPFAQVRAANDFGVLVHSYRDEVTVSVTVDTAIINHKDTVHLLLKEFVEEIQQLHSSIYI